MHYIYKDITYKGYTTYKDIPYKKLNSLETAYHWSALLKIQRSMWVSHPNSLYRDAKT